MLAGMTASERLARAVLMFYGGGPWNNVLQTQWRQITGTDDATTRVLGDLARAVLDEIVRPVECLNGAAQLERLAARVRDREAVRKLAQSGDSGGDSEPSSRG